MEAITIVCAGRPCTRARVLSSFKFFVSLYNQTNSPLRGSF